LGLFFTPAHHMGEAGFSCAKNHTERTERMRMVSVTRSTNSFDRSDILKGKM